MSVGAQVEGTYSDPGQGALTSRQWVDYELMGDFPYAKRSSACLSGTFFRILTVLPLADLSRETVRNHAKQCEDRKVAQPAKLSQS